MRIYSHHVSKLNIWQSGWLYRHNTRILAAVCSDNSQIAYNTLKIDVFIRFSCVHVEHMGLLY